MQALGRGLVPRLSMGTLQLSMRCSSVHFGPSLSLPVSSALPLGSSGEARFDLPGTGFVSPACAQEAKLMSNDNTINPLHGNLIC